MKKTGFTLIELMIVIAIIGILAAVAVPQYSAYTKRAEFSEVKTAAAYVKGLIETCYQINNGADACNTVSPGSPSVSGQATANGLKAASSASLVADVDLTGSTTPIIEVTAETIANNTSGFDGETYVLTGAVKGTALVDKTIEDWAESGTGCTKGWC